MPSGELDFLWWGMLVSMHITAILKGKASECIGKDYAESWTYTVRTETPPIATGRCPDAVPWNVWTTMDT